MKTVVLTSTPYSDNSYMTRLLTHDNGMVTASVHTGGKSARMRKSYLLPLTLLDVELAGRERNEVKYISDCNVYRQCNDIIANPEKMIASQFVCEMTEKALRFHASADDFDYVEQSVIELDSLNGDVDGWVIVYLYGLMQVVGIVPDLEGYQRGMSLDIIEGRVVGYGLYSSETAALIDILSGSAAGNRFKPVVEMLIKYFQTHLEGFGRVKTFDLFC